ncbi:hypothetical protein CDL15_Pgr005869 [Punica granatum]|uniref:Uncharacterized protein n=1 Tax=Punica granatum TaxID=22663 RepID=A0A218WHJ0_PUNGR|nr:hypothetical protein CDL15_Pgr005869 [Punica granatum]
MSTTTFDKWANTPLLAYEPSLSIFDHDRIGTDGTAFEFPRIRTHPPSASDTSPSTFQFAISDQIHRYLRALKPARGSQHGPHSGTLLGAALAQLSSGLDPQSNNLVLLLATSI